jgi:acyl-coenzyme A thioesterase PaaI-like protein
MADVRLEINNRCFGCGADNPLGLQMRIAREGDEYVSRLVVSERFQGWGGLAHGGFLCTVMDEVMAHAMRGGAYRSVTARINARFRKAVPIGSRITARGRLLGRRGKIVRTSARIELEDGAIAAEAEGTFVILAEGVGAA